MEQQKAVAYSAAALRIVEEMIEAGATAVKGESAGVAHGLKRWMQLASECKTAAKTSHGLAVTAAMSRTCRLAFAKRPLDGTAYNESVGFHLVGLPEIYVAKARGSDRDAVKTVMQPFAYPAGLEADAKADGFGRPLALPITYVIDRKGVVRAVFTPQDGALNGATLDRLTAPLLKHG